MVAPGASERNVSGAALRQWAARAGSRGERMNVGRNAILPRGDSGGDPVRPLKGRIFGPRYARGANVVARSFAGQGGRDCAADPPGAGLAERMDLPARFFGAEP